MYIKMYDEKKYDEIYDGLLSKEDKENETKAQFIDSLSVSADEREIIRSDTTINSTVVKDDKAFIDRTVNDCYTDDCSEKKSSRGYVKFVYEDGKWMRTYLDKRRCIREEPYTKPPEFDRAISLFFQRWAEKNGKGDDSIANCLDIQYANLTDAEGLFTFDNNSTMNRLTIYVDNSYKYKDDILTASLLSHEINHASTYLEMLAGNADYSCYEIEKFAFATQLFFIGALNTEEQDSLATRIGSLDISNNATLGIINNLISISANAIRYCGAGMLNCYYQNVDDQIMTMLKSNPYYQQQCAEN